MNYYKVISAFLFLFQFTDAQDKVKRFEFGPTFITINSLSKTYSSASDKPAYEITNGLLFKYIKNKTVLRALISYNESHLKFYAATGCIDCTNGESSNKDFKIGVGIQHTLLQKKEWLYGFVDVYYRNVFSSGFIYGGFAGYNNSFTASKNGVSSIVGLGLKLKIFEDIFVVPECGYSSCWGMVNYSTTHLILGNTSTRSYSQLNLNPIAKLHLTVRF